jgi:tetratricopeptide (TPR) repeat protein
MRTVTTANFSPDQAIKLAQQYAEAGRIGAATTLCRQILRARPDWSPALHLQGILAFRSDDFSGAINAMRRAVAVGGASAGCHHDLGVLYGFVGQIAEARQQYEKAIALDPGAPGYYFKLAEVTTFAAGDPRVAAMEKLAERAAAFPIASRVLLHFALAKAYQDLGRYDDAFRRLAAANALQRSQMSYDEAKELGRFARVRAVFDRDFMKAMAGIGYRSTLPVLIVGMPRSGTTLVEQILASHPSVHGAGEVVNLAVQVEQLRAARGGTVEYPEIVRSLSAAQLHTVGKSYVARLRRGAQGAARITDKNVSQFLYLGLAHLALPDARIIHARRNPLDICISCYATYFEVGQNFSYDLGELGRFYRAYSELMAHWRAVLPPDQFLEVSYEAVVTDFEAEARRVVAFCGLPWDPSCLDFHKTQRPVTTASFAQVRRPLYQSSRDRSQSYRKHLSPLIAALGDVAEP